MSYYFLIHNIHFALELMGAVIFLSAAWLTFDTYSFRKEFSTLARALGLSSMAVAQAVYALNSGSDILSYIGAIFMGLGLLLIVGSFLRHQNLQMQSVIIVPSFAQWSAYILAATAVLAAAISFQSFHLSRQEFNKTWIPFSISFFMLAIASVCAIFSHGDQTSTLAIVGYVFEFAGFVALAYWVWQYLQLRIRESIILIFISVALFLSTIVTLAFSTILIAQITSQTQANLLTDAKVLSLDIAGLKEQSLVKAQYIALNDDLNAAIVANDFAKLEEVSEQLMETHKLGFLTIVDSQGSVLVRAHTLSRRGDSLLGERALEEALRGGSYVTIENSPVEKLSIRAASPITGKDRDLIGVVIAGYPLDNALVDNIKRITGLEMFIYEQDRAVAATVLAADGRTRVTGITLGDEVVRATVLAEGSSRTAQADLHGRPFLMSYLPLINGDDKIIGMISAGKSQQDILDIANSTNRLTLITVILIMLILAYPIYLVTKRLSAEE